MKATKATLTYETEGTELTVEYQEMQVKDIAHALIELAQPKLEIVVSESQIERFRKEAREEINSQVGLSLSVFSHELTVDLIVRLKIEAFFRLEHARQAHNEAVLAYSKMFEELNERLNEK